MNNQSISALDVVRQALARYTEVPAADIHMETSLQDISIDSLTLAELLFELEDAVGVTLAEVEKLPQFVSELVAMIEPHLPQQPSGA